MDEHLMADEEAPVPGLPQCALLPKDKGIAACRGVFAAPLSPFRQNGARASQSPTKVTRLSSTAAQLLTPPPRARPARLGAPYTSMSWCEAGGGQHKIEPPPPARHKGRRWNGLAHGHSETMTAEAVGSVNSGRGRKSLISQIGSLSAPIITLSIVIGYSFSYLVACRNMY
jgi:hypothetical protein